MTSLPCLVILYEILCSWGVTCPVWGLILVGHKRFAPRLLAFEGVLWLSLGVLGGAWGGPWGVLGGSLGETLVIPVVEKWHGSCQDERNDHFKFGTDLF